jgi:DNA repair/transcription protein MET18/MMS19
MESDFLAGYCTLVEGEKDPRNLVVAFKLAKVILTEFELGDQAEV